MIPGTNFLDNDTKSILDGMPMACIDRDEIAQIKDYARLRKEAFMSGVIAAPEWVSRYLRSELKDPFLQFRWSFEYGCFVVDRWIEDWKCWVIILYWRNVDGTARNAGPFDMVEAATLLHINNMQALGYLKRKYEERDRIQTANKKKGEDMVLRAVDSLSTKQITEFVDVHRAIHTGEKIVLHGEAEKQMERMYENSKTALPLPAGRAINPGMNPRHYKRQPR